MSGEPIPLARRLGLRVGVLVALVVLAADLLAMLTWQEVAEWLHPDDYTPEALRAAADQLERTGEIQWLSAEDRNYWIFESLVFASALALFGAFLVSRFATRRLSRLAEQARGPVGEEHLPGPFEVTGRDEITVLARSMNAMRERVSELLEELARRDAARREWIAQVSHDLRTPVTALAIGLERSRELSGREDPSARAEAAELLGAARTDVRRVNDLTEDLLEIARLEAGDELVREPVPAGELVLQTVEGLLPVARERGIELAQRIPAGLPLLQADGRRLARALENLVLNSLQHARSRVLVAAEAMDGEVRFTVEDDGPGFPYDGARLREEDLGAARSRSDSAGLGLRVAVRVAEAHGGSVGARNPDAGGSVVWLAVPLDA